MQLSSIEKFLINRRRSSASTNDEFCKGYWKIVKGFKDVPEKHKEDPGHMDIGEVAFILRYRADLTMRALAKRMRCSHQTVHNREIGKKTGAEKQISHLKKHLKRGEKTYLKTEFNIKL